MIQNFRYYSESWFFKGFLALIVLAFVLLGVGDLVRSLVYDRPIATVGNHTISHEELERALRRDLQRIQMATKSQISIADLHQFGFVQKVLDRLIAQHLLEQEIARLNITASPNVIRNNAHVMEPFLREGQFDPTQFKSILRNAGISEQAFVNDIKKQITEQQYFSPFAQASVIPTYYKNMLLKSMLQKRIFSTVMIDTKKINIDTKINDDILKNFYDEHKDNYKKSETRDITFVNIDVKKMSDSISVSEEDLKALYENRMETYVVPEQRSVLKITMQTKTQADTVLEKLEKKVPLNIIEAEISDIKIEKLDLITKNQIDENDSDLIFSLEAGKHSDVVAQEMGFAIFIVEKIAIKKQKTYAEVKEDLKKEIQVERFQDSYKKLRNKLEDDMAGGAKIDDLAKELNLKLTTLNNIENDTNALDQKEEFKDISKEIIEQTFQLSEGNASNVIDISSDKSFMIVLNKINPENIPSFTDVQAQVKQDFIAKTKQSKAAELAQKISQEAKNISDLAKMANQNEVTLQTNQTYSRMKIAEDKKLQDSGAINVFDRAFALPINKAISSPVKDGFLVVMPEKNIENEVYDEKDKKEVLKRFDQIMYESIAGLLTESLKNRYNVKIKTDNLNAFLKSMTKE